MTRIRPERVAHLMQREIAEILENKLDDPRLAGKVVSVTEVEVTHDLSVARVYVSVLEEGALRADALEALHRAAGFVRHELAPKLNLREVPEIRFIHDPSIERGARVEEILRRLERGETVDDSEAP